MLVYDEIEAILFKSALDAYNRYIDWSGGDAAHDAGAESLITTSIANNIVATKDGGHVLCDAPFLKHRKQALKGARKARRAKSDQGRLGILLFNRRNQAIVAVEVKRSFVFSNIRGDIEKLKSLLLRHGYRKGSTLKAGYSVSIRELAEGHNASTREQAKAVAQRLARMRGMDNIYVRSKVSRLKRRRLRYSSQGRSVRIEGFEAVLIRLTLRRPRS
jgi:hypothetical protein